MICARKYTDNNFKTFFEICHRTALCLEYSLCLDTPFGESAFGQQENAEPDIDSDLEKTFSLCFRILAKYYPYFGSGNYPEGFLLYPADHILPAEDAYDPTNNKAQAGPDLFWRSVHSQCVMSAYDTLSQLLADEYISTSTLFKHMKYVHETFDSAHKIFTDTNTFNFPDQKETSDMNLTNAFNIRLRDRIANIYEALFQCTTEDLSSLGLAIESSTPITYDQNYHRLAIPSKTLLRFFHHERSQCPKFKFEFCLTGPDFPFIKSDAVNYSVEDMTDSKDKTCKWAGNSLSPDYFPYAKAIGSYEFTLTISFAKRISEKTPSLTFSCTVSIQNGDDVSPSTKDEAPEAKYIDLPSRSDNETLSPVEYFPLNLFDFNNSEIFSLYNLDFYNCFSEIPPKSIQKYTKLLCCSISDNPDKSFSLDTFCENNNIRYLFSKDIEQLYLHYQGEKMFGFDSTETIFDLEKKLLKRGIILNDEEFHSLCQLGSSRNIFSRSFFLEFALLPLFKKKSLASSALIPEEVKNDDSFSPVSFGTKNHHSFQRDLWHRYLKQFSALWSNLIMPACEWFFILSLFHSYGINFHEPAGELSGDYKEKMVKIYQNLCDYIKRYHKIIEKPLSGSIIPDSEEKNGIPLTSLPYSKEYIMNSIAKKNRIRALNLSGDENNPVFLHSLAYFSKDTILRKQNENLKISNANLIQQAYKKLWL